MAAILQMTFSKSFSCMKIVLLFIASVNLSKSNIILFKSSLSLNNAGVIISDNVSST